MANAVPHRTLLCKGILSGFLIPDWTWSSLNRSIRVPDAWICWESAEINDHMTLSLTLIASVRIVAITSKPPLETQFEGRAGSYSQIAVFVSTAAILVMWDITSIVARFITCARHLSGVNQGDLIRESDSHIFLCLMIPWFKTSTLMDFGDGLAKNIVYRCIVEGYAI